MNESHQNTLSYMTEFISIVGIDTTCDGIRDGIEQGVECLHRPLEDIVAEIKALMGDTNSNKLSYMNFNERSRRY